MSGPDTAEAIARYHAIIESDPALASECAAMLEERQPAAHLTFGGKPLCTVLRPEFLTSATYSQIQQVCHLLSDAMFRLAQHIINEPSLLDALYLRPVERELVAVHPGYSPVSPTSRLDSFMAGEQWHFVEYNAETPAAIAYEDGLSQLFLELPAMQRFSREYVVRTVCARHHLRDTLLDVYRQWGGRNTPTIAVVDWKGLPTATEHQLFAEDFESAGYPALVAEPAELDYDGTYLRAGDTRIDLVYRRVLTSELLSQPEVARPLIQAYKDHRVCVVNSFRSKLLHKKLIFALLSDERYAHYFSAEEREAISAHVPWTRHVADQSTTHGGRRIDLVPFVLDHRERLVLKPNDEYGGKGVVIGWESSAEEWKAAVSDALDEPFVVQERVPIGREPFPAWKDGQLHWPELSADLDPFLFKSSVKGLLVRLSAASLLNVTAGTGSVAPAFLVDKK